MTMNAQTTQGNPHWHNDGPQPPAGPPGMDKPPRGHGRAWLIAAVAAASVMAAGGGAAAGVALTHSAPKPATAAPNPAKPAPATTEPVPLPAAPGAPASAQASDQYVQDIWNAGVTAPASWIDPHGRTLVADWRAGDTKAWTDANVLAPGGVSPYHYGSFDQVTERDFGVYPPPDTAPDPSNDVTVVNQYLSDLNDGDYADAWDLGGDNLNDGSGYDAWVAGYSTTTSMSWSPENLGNGVVAVNLIAYQTDGSTNTYTGTYKVSNGVIISADLPQTG